MQTTWEFVQKVLVAAQDSQSKQVNKYRIDITYAVGDKIWLSIKNIINDQSSKKIDHKTLGPLEFKGNKDISVKLQLS